MHSKRTYLIIVIVLILIGGFLVYKVSSSRSNTVTRIEPIDNFGNSHDRRMLKCWVRELVPKGYDSYGHEIQPASIELESISIKRDKRAWVLYSKLFAGKNAQERTYYIKQSSSGTFTLYQSNDRKVGVVSKNELEQRYKNQTI